MNNEIESSTYQTWFKKFKEDRAILESFIKGYHKSLIVTNENIKQRLMPYMSKLHDIYDKGNIVQKQTLIRGVFKDNLTWGDGAFRTAFINPTFHNNLLKIKEKGLLFDEQSLINLDKSPVSTPSRSRTGQVSFMFANIS